MSATVSLAISSASRIDAAISILVAAPALKMMMPPAIDAATRLIAMNTMRIWVRTERPNQRRFNRPTRHGAAGAPPSCQSAPIDVTFLSPVLRIFSRIDCAYGVHDDGDFLPTGGRSQGGQRRAGPARHLPILHPERRQGGGRALLCPTCGACSTAVLCRCRTPRGQPNRTVPEIEGGAKHRP